MANKLDPMDLKQIITLRLDGFSNRQIGKQLGVSRNTVNNYVGQFRASGKSLDELLALDNKEFEELFPSATTIENARYDQLMRFFEKSTKLENLQVSPSRTTTNYTKRNIQMAMHNPVILTHLFRASDRPEHITRIIHKSKKWADFEADFMNQLENEVILQIVD